MKNYFILLLLILSFYNGKCQTTQKNDDDLNAFTQMPKESVFVHFNTSLLFVGEYFYYKLYCFNSIDSLFSTFSKAAYIELIGENKSIVFKHKVILENGVGNGDFFIPSEIPSGNYKIIAYTNWMKNEGINSFYQNDVTIINPYQSDQNSLRGINQDSIVETNTIENKNLQTNFLAANTLSLELNKMVYATREEVKISIKSLDSTIANGSYSLSIRQVNTIKALDKISSLDFNKSNSNTFKLNSEVFLPELRGEIIKGKVTNLTNNMPVQNAKIALSIPNEPYQYYYASTNENGVFFMNIDKRHNTNKGHIQVLDDKRAGYKIEIEESKSLDYTALNYKKYSLTPEMEKSILKRSINNQIENAFFSFRPDSIVVINNSIPFNKSEITTIDLELFERFPTIRETFVEVVNQAWIEKRGDDNYVFNIRPYEKYADSNDLPLVLIDGIIVYNHNDLMGINAYSLNSISLLRDKYVIGTKLYKGIISFSTIDGKYTDLKTDGAVKYIDLFSPQPIKQHYKQLYLNQIQRDSHLPDDRIQLMWIPNLGLTPNTLINCFTSDVTGEFEVNLEGFTENGLPVSITKNFTVD